MKNYGDLVKELRELHREELALYLVPENHGKSKCVGWVRVDLLKESADAVAALDANVTLLGASMTSMQKQIDGLEALLVDSEAEVGRHAQHKREACEAVRQALSLCQHTPEEWLAMSPELAAFKRQMFGVLETRCLNLGYGVRAALSQHQGEGETA